MKQSFMQHQRELDDAAEIEALADEWRKAAEEEMTALRRFEYPILTKHGTLSDDYIQEFEVPNAMGADCADELELAFSLLDKDPDEAIRILKEARDKCVADILAGIDFEAVAKGDIEQSRRSAA